MKILRIYPFFQTEFKYLEHYLTAELNEMGCQTTFLTSNCINPHWKRFTINKSEYDLPYLENDGYKIYRISSRLLGSKPLPTDFKRIKKIMKDGEFDIVHFSGIAGFFTPICIRLYLKIEGTSCIFINDHSNPAVQSSSLMGRMYYKMNNLVFKTYQKYIKGIISPNEGSKNLLRERYKLKDGSQYIIPLGYDQNIYSFDPKHKNNSTKLVVGFAGKLEPRKKIERLFEAIPWKDREKYEIVIVGGIEGDEYTEKLKSLAIEKDLDVTFKSLIETPKGLMEFYNYIDIAVFPGSISITTVEANASGTPVVIYRSMQGLEYRVENGRGRLFDTIEELSTQLEEFRINKEEIDNQSIAIATLDYSWKKISEKYYDLYTK